MKKLGHEIGLPLGGKGLIDIIKDRAKRIDFPWSRNKTKPVHKNCRVCSKLFDNKYGYIEY